MKTTLSDAAVDAMLAAYIACALWSSTDDDGLALDESYDETDIAPATLAEMRSDVEAFLNDHREDIGEETERAGQDFWLTRNHHGAGFWDGDWPTDAGRTLTDAAHVYGAVDLYVGDDGLVHA